ncbi:MAG: hypothetical protein WC604_04265 [Candidatus Gracilibacteria bacterium]
MAGFNEVYSKKYLATILAILVGIAAAVFAISQWFVSQDTPENMTENSESVVGDPSTTLPTTPPHVEPPTTPPPGF